METDILLVKAKAMSGARRIMKKPKTIMNWVLYMDLFGTGSTTATKSCESLGLDPASTETSFCTMRDHIKKPS